MPRPLTVHVHFDLDPGEGAEWEEVLESGRIVRDALEALASIYSVRPRPQAPVSTPVTWKEVDKGVRIEDFRMDNVRERFAKVGDLWKPLLQTRGRVSLEKLLTRPG